MRRLSISEEERKERRRAACRKWQAAHKEYVRDQAKKYHAANKEKVHERKREYRKRNPERMRRQGKASRERRSASIKEYSQRYNRLEYVKAKVRARNKERDSRCEVDAEFYARVRRKQRIYNARRKVSKGKIYRADISRRIPDYMVKGELVKIQSPEPLKYGAWDAVNRGYR